jgi:DNA-binding response OmpR family regulator
LLRLAGSEAERNGFGIGTVRTQNAILIVEDDPGVRQTLAAGLSDRGYMVVTAASAEEALSRLAVISVDLVLTDLRLPGMSGVELLRELRQLSTTMVLVIMTADPSIDSTIAALRLEVHDYLIKPFALDEVEQVVRRGLERRQRRDRRERLLRQLERNLAGLQSLQLFSEDDAPSDKAPPPPINPGLLCYGPIEIDMQRHLVRVDGKELDLTPTEFNLLVTLADRAPAVVSPQELLRQATGYQADLNEARELIKWHIHHLRRKIESDSKKPQHIITVRGVGYRLSTS